MATYFWVGGDGVWDASSTTNWSASSGGAGGAGAPNNTDEVVFDANSGTGTCTTASGSACNTANLNSSTLGLTLGANHTMGAFTLTRGILSLDAFTLSCTTFISNNANARSIAFGTGNITLISNGVFVLSMSDATNFTYTGTPTINATYAGAVGTRSFRFGATGGTEANSLNINITAGTDSISTSTLRARNLDFTGFSGTLLNQGVTLFGGLTISSGMTLVAGASTTIFAATSGTHKITTNGKTLDFPVTQNGIGSTLQLQDNLTMGSTSRFTLTAGTLSLNNLVLSCGNFNSNNSNVRSISFGTGNITLTGNAGDVLNLTTGTNSTVSGSRNVFATYSGGVGTRTMSGWLSSFADETNTVNLFVTGGTDIVNLRYNFLSANLTGFAGTLQNTVTAAFWQDLTIPSGVTHIPNVSNSFFAFMCPTAATITTNGMTFNCPINFGFNVGKTVTTGTYSFQDALNQGSTYATTLVGGTVQLKNGVTSTVGAFATSGADQKFLQSTIAGSQATLSQASGTVNTNNLTIRDINATGGATWDAYTTNNNVDAGNNLGWDFSFQLGRYIYTRRKNKRILP